MIVIYSTEDLSGRFSNQIVSAFDMCLVEEVWGIPILVTPADVLERDMVDIQKFMPPEGRLFLASDDTAVMGCDGAGRTGCQLFWFANESRLSALPLTLAVGRRLPPSMTP